MAIFYNQAKGDVRRRVKKKSCKRQKPCTIETNGPIVCCGDSWYLL